MVGLQTTAYPGCRGDAARPDPHRALQGQDRRQGRHANPRRAWGVSEIGRVEARLLAERSGAERDQRRALDLEAPPPGEGSHPTREQKPSPICFADRPLPMGEVKKSPVDISTGLSITRLVSSAESAQ